MVRSLALALLLVACSSAPTRRSTEPPEGEPGSDSPCQDADKRARLATLEAEERSRSEAWQAVDDERRAAERARSRATTDAEREALRARVESLEAELNATYGPMEEAHFAAERLRVACRRGEQRPE